MYSGNNPTAINSMKWLTQATVDALKEKPFSQITITDICKRADLSRQTFYNFFDCVEEVLRYYLKEQCKVSLFSLLQMEDAKLKDAVFAFEKVIEENRDVLELLFKNKLHYIVIEEISRCVTTFTEKFAPIATTQITNYKTAFVSGALTNILLCWIKDKTPLSSEELAEFLENSFNGCNFII